MEIRKDDLSSREITAFLREHLENMHEITPPQSVHTLGLGALRSPDITFWSAWEGKALLGCGALKDLGGGRGEVKSMRTAAAYRGRGVGSKILEHILKEAAQRGYESLSLETGAMLPFAPARTLYLRYGFEFCGPFADYEDDPNSVFMIKKL